MSRLNLKSPFCIPCSALLYQPDRTIEEIKEIIWNVILDIHQPNLSKDDDEIS